MTLLLTFHLGKKVTRLYLTSEGAAAAAKSLQSCPTLWDPIDSSPPGSSIPGILQARTLEWVAISFSNAWKWKVKRKSLSLSNSSRPHGLQPTRLLCPWDFPGKSTRVGCHCLLRYHMTGMIKWIKVYEVFTTAKGTPISMIPQSPLYILSLAWLPKFTAHPSLIPLYNLQSEYSSLCRITYFFVC